MRVVVVLLFAAVTAACAAAPARPLAGPDPADPAAPAPQIRHASALRTYLSLRPVDPQPWRKRNEDVTPRPQQ